MKTKQKSTISLKKLTIAKINQNSMIKIKGGDCDPKEPDFDSHWTHCGCPNVF